MRVRLNLVFGIIFIAYYIFLLTITGYTTINLAFLLAGFVFLGIYYLDVKYERRRNIKKYLRWRKRVLVGISIILGGIILIDSTILIFAMNKDYKKAECVMILGAGLKGDKVSATLKTRLDGAIDFMNNGEGYDFIVVSGGKGSDELISEAEAMRRYLVDKGIPNSKILLEDKSTSTFENFKFSKDIITSHSGKYIEDINVKFFTNGFHTMRSYFLGKRLGYDELSAYGTKTPFYLAPYYYFREIFAMGKSIVFDK